MNVWIAFACGVFMGAPLGLFVMAWIVSGKREPTTIRETRDRG